MGEFPKQVPFKYWARVLGSTSLRSFHPYPSRQHLTALIDQRNRLARVDGVVVFEVGAHRTTVDHTQGTTIGAGVGAGVGAEAEAEAGTGAETEAT